MNLCKFLKVILGSLSAIFFTCSFSAEIVFTDGDSNIAYIVNTANSNTSSFSLLSSAGGEDARYPISIFNNQIITSARGGQGSTIFNLTGSLLNSYSYPSNTNYDQLLDGTTDGHKNYAIRCCSGADVVISADLNWSNTQILFSIPFGGSGITYDPKTNTLWLADFSGNIINTNMAGIELSRFNVGTEIRGLSFNIKTGTLWFLDRNTLYQYSKTGTLISSTEIAGIPSGNNIYGGEFEFYNFIVGPSTADTQQSLVNTAAVLQNTYTLQNSVLANSFSYDCNEFGANGICISAGSRNTAVSAANGLNNTSALLIAAYRPHPNYRVGAYADQNLSVNNAGSTVNLGNNTPLLGLFGAWNQRLDGTGTEVKVSAAYGQKNTSITRQVVGTSEAGSGSSQLNSQGAQVSAKYGFAVTDKIIVSPYVGVRYTQNNMGGYTEGASSTVTAPLTYSALNTNATTALAGVGASYKVIPTVTTYASAGVETDTNTANGTYSATNTSIGTLTPVNFNANPVKTRPTATLGAYYDIVKNQRLGITGIYRQESYQAVSTTTVMATYTIGL